ncbi:hypothetical protein ACHQM5_001589 [Ranunculus cassubicifolius]
MLSTPSNHLNLHVQSSNSTEFHLYTPKKRLKFHKKTPKFSCKLRALNAENPFQNLISKLGFSSKSSGSSLYLPDSKSSSNNNNDEVGEFGERILFTSPTPFNRFVLLRCPSIEIEGSELLDDLNERLVKEDRHYVKIINERIEVKETVVYQRSCVSTGDGGMISLDWPENLDLMEEIGIDTTVLLVPGSVQGSMDENVMSFVSELVKSGCFPVVMNPRGCGGSPLTTPRLFTAADSDDICTAIQFVNKARPGNTLLSIGWGLGANMLTKYLAEVSEKTPLTAATCIDSPFDLEEATRSSPYHVAIDQKLTSGLVDILQSNKELFQGRPKRFNVEKALSSTSLRDFEREISMISYGFESIEAFYSKSSTRELVGNVKIPLLFIQSDEGMVPPFSIPRGVIAENPFTSLLLCSYLPSGNNDISVLPWCQHFAMEWLTAVELGFLKGRHPTLTDVDITINPSASLLVENKEHSGVNKYASIKETDASNESHRDPIDNDTENKGDPVSQGSETGKKSEESGLDDDIPVSEMAEAEDDNSQALQSAEAVMKMLDASMPGALDEEQKRKVMIAMAQGATLMRAVEGAVPEEAWGTLTTGVSEIMQKQGANLNLPGMANDPPPPPDASSVDTTKVEEETVDEGIDDVRSVEDLVDETPSGNEKERAVEKSIEDEPQNVQAESEVGSELEEAKDSTVNKKEKVKADMDVSDDQNESSSTLEMTKEEPNSGSPKVEDEDNQDPSNSEEEGTAVVSQAVDAVTKFNDDPQEALNSVIGVAENVATKLEESSGNESEKTQEGSAEEENAAAKLEESSGDEKEKTQESSTGGEEDD